VNLVFDMFAQFAFDRRDEHRRMAAAVIGHLRLCGWSWTRKPPVDGHG